MGFLAMFKKKGADDTLPATDTERWITATYAMWSECAGGDWHYFAGAASKGGKEEASMRAMLCRAWEITDRAWEVTDRLSLLNMASWLIEPYNDETNGCSEEARARGGWNLCRACQILAMGYVSGYIDREEMVEESVKAGKVMQRMYPSWSELYDSYLRGYKECRMNQGGGWRKDAGEREGALRRLETDPEGPCALPWETELE